MNPKITPDHLVSNLGVDDWAWRKGQEYGTILVNLDAHRVVDLLPDRAADNLSEWLQCHSEILTVPRSDLPMVYKKTSPLLQRQATLSGALARWKGRSIDSR